VDPAEEWRRRHARLGRRATLIHRYELEAAARGCAPENLSPEDRARLAREVLAAQSPGLEVLPSGGRAAEPIVVAPYDEAWPATFSVWRDRLRAALGERALRIEHVGSTAVRGLVAKPIVDVQVSVEDAADESSYAPAVESTGLVLRLREEGHRYFRPPAGEARTAHVHVCDAGGAWEREHLLFRDYLRAHPGAAAAYGSLKHGLASRHAGDRLAYTDAKTAFVLDALEQAEPWARRTGWSLPPPSRPQK
jgi:GrpB-like predicted nucleotidyltransferase (UPF0157 family)